MPVNYGDGKIYEILFGDGSSYVGSTAQRLSKRLYEHKKNSASSNMKKAFKDNTDYRIVLIEKWDCVDKDELRMREQYWLDKKKPSLNMTSAYTSPEKTRQKLKDYYIINKEKRKISSCGFCDVCEIEYKSGFANHGATSMHYRMNISNRLERSKYVRVRV